MSQTNSAAPRSVTVGQRVTATVGIVASTVAVGGCAAPDESRPGGSVMPSGSATVEEADTDATTYRDGEYSARGWYGSLPSHHDVTVTVRDDIVIDVTITTPAEDEVSLGYQQRFAEALPVEVVGKPLAEIDVDRLAGSSGCSEGFMNALQEIREDARR